MTAVELDTQALDGLLLGFLDKVQGSFFSSAWVLFSTLYSFGFRISELKGLHNWQLTTDGHVIASTVKGGDPRSIPAVEVHGLVIRSIEEGVNFVFTASYRTYDHFFQGHKGCVSLSAGGKELSTHAFRHNYIRRLAAAGLSAEEIRVHMGLRQVGTVLGYLTSTVTAVYV